MFWCHRINYLMWEWKNLQSKGESVCLSSCLHCNCWKSLGCKLAELYAILQDVASSVVMEQLDCHLADVDQRLKT